MFVRHRPHIGPVFGLLLMIMHYDSVLADDTRAFPAYANRVTDDPNGIWELGSTDTGKQQCSVNIALNNRLYSCGDAEWSWILDGQELVFRNFDEKETIRFHKISEDHWEGKDANTQVNYYLSRVGGPQSRTDQNIATVRSNPTFECDQIKDLDLEVVGCSALIDAARKAGAVDVDAMLKLAQAYSDKHIYDLAMQTFDEVIRVKPTSRAYAARAFTNEEQSRFDSAMSDVKQALTLDEKNVFALIVMGIVHARTGELDDAFKDYDKAIAIDSNYAPAWFCRGDWYVDKKQYDNAEKDINNAIRLDPSNWIYHNDLGHVLGLQGKYRAALSEFSTAVSLAGPSSSLPATNYRRLQKAIIEDNINSIAEFFDSMGGGFDGASDDNYGSSSSNARQLWDQQRSDEVERGLRGD